MDIKRQHKHYLTKGMFNLGSAKVIFNQEERQLLEQRGHWYKALTDGILTPTTEAQKAFVIATTGTKKPIDVIHLVWWRYLRRVKLMSEHQDYGKQKHTVKKDTFYTREAYKQMHPKMYAAV